MTRLFFAISFALLMFAQTALAQDIRVRMTFSQLGSVDVLLDPNTPQTTACFLNYVTAGLYNGTVIHRSDQTDAGVYVIQGGGYVPNSNPDVAPSEIAQTYTAPYASTGLSNVEYTLAAASTAAAGPMSSQWDFNMGNNSDLDGSYCAFGTAVGGTSVLNSIFGLTVYDLEDSSPFSTVPLFPSYTTFPPQAADWVTLTSCYRTQSLGDFNQDGAVDASDFTVWAANVGKIGTAWMAGDANGDGLVDVADYDIWFAHQGVSAPAVSPAPEPATISLLALAGLAILRRRK
jgi:cyclophilin family peptidyl-prolyl cis-trans isomerase